MRTRARVENGEIVSARLPRTGTLSDGRKVSGYANLMLDDPDLAYAEGWREVVDAGPPEYDSETHRVQRTLEVQGDEVHATYEIVELPPDPSQGDHLDPSIGAPDA